MHNIIESLCKFYYVLCFLDKERKYTHVSDIYCNFKLRAVLKAIVFSVISGKIQGQIRMLNLQKGMTSNSSLVKSHKRPNYHRRTNLRDIFNPGTVWCLKNLSVN